MTKQTKPPPSFFKSATSGANRSAPKLAVLCAGDKLLPQSTNQKSQILQQIELKIWPTD